MPDKFQDRNCQSFDISIIIIEFILFKVKPIN